VREVRFYLEFSDAKAQRAGKHAGTVVAINPDSGRLTHDDDGPYRYVYDGVGAVYGAHRKLAAWADLRRRGNKPRSVSAYPTSQVPKTASNAFIQQEVEKIAWS
jgi:hypothetical protein